jgi:Pyruvate/2-oxoacid:ferredoxin oxidoreductase delta subunit
MGADEIVLKTSGCRSCDGNTALAIIERLARNGRDLLEVFGRSTTITVSEEADRATAPGEADGNALEDAAHERRQFLRALRSGALAVAGIVAEGAIDSLAEVVSPGTSRGTPVGLEHRVPDKRRMLLSVLQRLGKPRVERISGACLPAAHVSLDDHCLLCDCCSQLCPTGALRSTTAGGTKAIEFFLSRCTGCQVCQLACLDGALDLHGTIGVVELLEDRGETLISYPAHRCESCGETFGAREPGRYCHYCERKMTARNAPW